MDENKLLDTIFNTLGNGTQVDNLQFVRSLGEQVVDMWTVTESDNGRYDLHIELESGHYKLSLTKVRGYDNGE